MQQTSLLFPSKSHPLATKLLTIVLSIGAHYVVASNLGIFGWSVPPKLKPVGGTVKVVDLTAAEQTRVPEAVKSNPLPIAQTPVNPAPATRSGSGFPTTPNNIAVPTPPAQQNASPPTTTTRNTSSQSPSSSPTPPRPQPRKSARLGIDPNNKFPAISPERSTESGGDGGNPNRRRGTGSPNNGKPSRPANNGSEDQSSDEVPPTSTPTSSPTPTPTSIPDPPANNLVQVQRNFDREVQKLKQVSGSGNNIVERNINVSGQTYPPINRCSRQQNGYILVGILLNESGERADVPILPLQMSPFMGDKLNNVLADKALNEAERIAQQQHAGRNESQKQADRGKLVLYKIRFEYERGSCKG